MYFILIITVTLMSMAKYKKSNTNYNDPPLNSINKDKIILSYYSFYIRVKNHSVIDFFSLFTKTLL